MHPHSGRGENGRRDGPSTAAHSLSVRGLRPPWCGSCVTLRARRIVRLRAASRCRSSMRAVASARLRWCIDPPIRTRNLPVAGSDPASERNSPTNFEQRWCRNGCEPRCQTSLVNDSAPIRARAGNQQAFGALTEPYRRELQLHCYRILGQVQDAEDAVQETLLSAWRALESFEERSTLRSWLYRIATNRCLNMLRDSGRRPATTSGVASTAPEPTRYGEVLWLEPYPDALLEGIADSAAGPEARYETHKAVTLAFLTALHRLPPRQRAVLVLRDVLGFSATDVAAMLETTQTSVNSALIRARATIEERGPRTDV